MVCLFAEQYNEKIYATVVQGNNLRTIMLDFHSRSVHVWVTVEEGGVKRNLCEEYLMYVVSGIASMHFDFVSKGIYGSKDAIAVERGVYPWKCGSRERVLYECEGLHIQVRLVTVTEEILATLKTHIIVVLKNIGIYGASVTLCAKYPYIPEAVYASGAVDEWEDGQLPMALRGNLDILRTANIDLEWHQQPTNCAPGACTMSGEAPLLTEDTMVDTFVAFTTVGTAVLETRMTTLETVERVNSQLTDYIVTLADCLQTPETICKEGSSAEHALMLVEDVHASVVEIYNAHKCCVYLSHSADGGAYMLLVFRDIFDFMQGIYNYLQLQNVISSFNLRTDLTMLLIEWRRLGIAKYARVYDPIETACPENTYASDPHWHHEMPWMVKADHHPPAFHVALEGVSTGASKDYDFNNLRYLNSIPWHRRHLVWPQKVLVDLCSHTFDPSAGPGGNSLNCVAARILESSEWQKTTIDGVPEDPLLRLDYCARDAFLHHLLFEKLQPLSTALVIERQSAIPLHAMCASNNPFSNDLISKCVIGKLLDTAKPLIRGRVCKFILSEDKLDERFDHTYSLKGKGAFVCNPVLCTSHEAPSRLVLCPELLVIDGESFYPNIITNYNISPDTWTRQDIGEGVSQQLSAHKSSNCQDIHNQQPEQCHFAVTDIRRQFAFLIQQVNTADAPESLPPGYFAICRKQGDPQEQIGLLPQKMTELLAMRGEFRAYANRADIGDREKNMYTVAAAQVKRITNSLIGCFGMKSSPLYSYTIAEAVYSHQKFVIATIINDLYKFRTCETCRKTHYFQSAGEILGTSGTCAEMCEMPKPGPPLELVNVFTDSFCVSLSPDDDDLQIEQMMDILKTLQIQKCVFRTNCSPVKFTVEARVSRALFLTSASHVYKLQGSTPGGKFIFKGKVVNRSRFSKEYPPQLQTVIQAICKYIINAQEHQYFRDGPYPRNNATTHQLEEALKLLDPLNRESLTHLQRFVCNTRFDALVLQPVFERHHQFAQLYSDAISGLHAQHTLSNKKQCFSIMVDTQLLW